MRATAQTLIPEPFDAQEAEPVGTETLRVVRQQAREVELPVLCEGCGQPGSPTRMLLTGNGHLCQSCELDRDLERAARRSFFSDIATAVALAFAGPSALLAALLLSGLLFEGATSVTGAMFLLYGAAFVATMQGVFGLWTAITGGARDAQHSVSHRRVLRAVGALSAAEALVVGFSLLAINLAMVFGG